MTELTPQERADVRQLSDYRRPYAWVAGHMSTYHYEMAETAVDAAPCLLAQLEACEAIIARVEELALSWRYGLCQAEGDALRRALEGKP